VSRLPIIEPDVATGEQAKLLARTKATLGSTPNMTKAMALNPAVLAAYLDLTGDLARGALSADVRERIAIGTSELNGCGYCVAAHTHVGRTVRGIPDDELAASRRFASQDPKVAAILRFAQQVTEQRGAVPDADLEAARAAGWTDAELAEVVAVVALTFLTNAYNRLAHPPLDFPAVDAPAASSAAA